MELKEWRSTPKGVATDADGSTTTEARRYGVVCRAVCSRSLPL